MKCLNALLNDLVVTPMSQSNTSPCGGTSSSARAAYTIPSHRHCWLLAVSNAALQYEYKDFPCPSREINCTRICLVMACL